MQRCSDQRRCVAEDVFLGAESSGASGIWFIFGIQSAFVLYCFGHEMLELRRESLKCLITPDLTSWTYVEDEECCWRAKGASWDEVERSWCWRRRQDCCWRLKEQPYQTALVLLLEAVFKYWAFFKEVDADLWSSTLRCWLASLWSTLGLLSIGNTPRYSNLWSEILQSWNVGTV